MALLQLFIFDTVYIIRLSFEIDYFWTWNHHEWLFSHNIEMLFTVWVDQEKGRRRAEVVEKPSPESRMDLFEMVTFQQYMYVWLNEVPL